MLLKEKACVFIEGGKTSRVDAGLNQRGSALEMSMTEQSPLLVNNVGIRWCYITSSSCEAKCGKPRL